MNDRRAILIAGPTGTGKTRIAATLASDVGGVVINADSMQVYEDLRVLTARPTVEEEIAAPHRLYGYIDAEHAHSVAEWNDDAIAEIENSWAIGALPIIVGGTGLYLHSLLKGLAPVPEIDPVVRRKIREDMTLHGPEVMHARLEGLDAAAFASLKTGDRQRISRALEVVMSTGKALGEWQEMESEGFLTDLDNAGGVMKIVLDWPRHNLYTRCDERVVQMTKTGAVEEVKALMARELAPDLPLKRAIGVVPLMDYIDGETDLDTAIGRMQMRTRNYVKRQLTWARHQFSAWTVEDAQDSERIIFKIFSKIKNFELTT